MWRDRNESEEFWLKNQIRPMLHHLKKHYEEINGLEIKYKSLVSVGADAYEAQKRINTIRDTRPQLAESFERLSALATLMVGLNIGYAGCGYSVFGDAGPVHIPASLLVPCMAVRPLRGHILAHPGHIPAIADYIAVLLYQLRG